MVTTTSIIDRLIFTALFSIIIHMVIVLGVSFHVALPPSNTKLVNLDIILVKQQTVLEPEQADFFAQANNQGGGLTDKKPPDPTPNTVEQSSSDLTESITDPKPLPITQTIAPQTVEPVIADPVKPEQVKADNKPATLQTERVIQQQDDRKVVLNKPAETVKSTVEHTAKPIAKLSAKDLILQAKNDIATLQARLEASGEALSKRPRIRYISPSTKGAPEAYYMNAWAMKVERIGNMNYPQEAKRQGINGSLRLRVYIEADGSVGPDGIVISSSSGFDVLDQAAVRIVRLGAPYAAIPEEVLQGEDILAITRTWKFGTNRGLSTTH